MLINSKNNDVFILLGFPTVWGTKNAVNHLIFSVFYFKGGTKGGTL